MISAGKAKFYDESKRTEILQIAFQADNAHHIILGLGANGKVYMWSRMYGHWEFYQPDAYKITRPERGTDND